MSTADKVYATASSQPSKIQERCSIGDQGILCIDVMDILTVVRKAIVPEVWYRLISAVSLFMSLGRKESVTPGGQYSLRRGR